MKEKNPLPPAWVFRFMRWFCPPHLLEEIEGDLLERYHHHIKTKGPRKAKWILAWSAIRFLRPGILLRNKFTFNITSLYMLSNYLKISARVMFRNKAFSALNISGLVLGMTGSMLLFLWILHESSYDRSLADCA